MILSSTNRSVFNERTQGRWKLPSVLRDVLELFPSTAKLNPYGMILGGLQVQPGWAGPPLYWRLAWPADQLTCPYSSFWMLSGFPLPPGLEGLQWEACCLLLLEPKGRWSPTTPEPGACPQSLPPSGFSPPRPPPLCLSSLKPFLKTVGVP